MKLLKKTEIRTQIKISAPYGFSSPDLNPLVEKDDL